jgi:hypothetical protein
MTDDQAKRLRVLMQEALEQVLERPIAFVLVAQDEDRNLEIVTNAAHRDQLPDLLLHAAQVVRTPPDSHIHDHRAAGESAVAGSSAPGMECGHAAAQPGASSSPPTGPGVAVEQAAAAAVSEDCNWMPKWPEDSTRCPNKATGVIRLKLHAAAQ